MATKPIDYSFGAESFLGIVPPNHAQERRRIVFQIVMVLVLFIYIIPRFYLSHGRKKGETKTNPVEDEPQKKQETKKTRRKKQSSDQKLPEEESSNVVNDMDGGRCQAVPKKGLPNGINVFLIFSCLTIIFFLILSSPNNSYSARAVFQTPLLTREECRDIIAMAERAADRNYQEAIMNDTSKLEAGGNINAENHEDILQGPKGWHKKRHKSYPTVDLNVVIDPFTPQDRSMLRQKLDARLAPIIERVYGIIPGAIRANDMFIVRYDAAKGQVSLNTHTDSSDLSFNILLNDEFEGGGTRFHNRYARETFDVKPPLGNVLLHNAVILHEGLPITSGTRFILVGFLNVDIKDPFTGKPTGLSAFTSWLSISWLQVKFKEGYDAAHFRIDNAFGTPASYVLEVNEKWTDNKYVRATIRDLKFVMNEIGDFWAPHYKTRLVHPGRAMDYIKALDVAYEKQVAAEKGSSGGRTRASWFQGQQIQLDLDGSISGTWDSRDDIKQEVFSDGE